MTRERKESSSFELRRDSLLASEARGPVDWLRSPVAIRARCEEILARGLEEQLEHFRVRLERVPAVVERVVATTHRNYPDLVLPHHGRYGHLRADGVDRIAWLEEKLAPLPEIERARARVELVVTSVLLDAGAGAKWRYREARTGLEAGRSEGLAMASYQMFESGLFSSDPARPLRADADALHALEPRKLGLAFQVSAQNPMAGLEGRAELLARLGSALRASPAVFGESEPRIGRLFDYLAERATDGRIQAKRLLTAVLESLGPIWPGRIALGGVNLGDVWRHPAAGGSGETQGLVPFHKLSQWLVYSLVEPLEVSGLGVDGLEELTGLAEYRNGGLFVDEGVLEPRHDAVTREVHRVDSEVVVEWRALTVALLERVATGVRATLGKSATELPMSKVLEGGTWAAGREAAREKRPDGGPPIQIQSDGTVF